MNRIIFLGTLIVAALACPTKEESLECFYKTADKNKDGRISKHELSRAIDRHLPWWQRVPFKLFGGIERVMTDCDANHDGYLTKAESYDMKDTCLETCYKRTNTISTFAC